VRRADHGDLPFGIGGPAPLYNCEMNEANHSAPRIVLVGTQHPGNIGSAARAMKTMGLDQLVLVAPERFPHPEAEALAAGADDVLAAARIVPDLATALADCTLVIGTSARRRGVPMPELAPREAAAQLVQAHAHGGGRAALVFGRERTGLENEELQLCHASVLIPANPAYSSLNLAAAVQVLAYEVRLAMLAQAGEGAAREGGPAADAGPADHADMERFFAHLAEFMDQIDFHKGRDPAVIGQRMRRLFLRAQPDMRELRILRGLFSDVQRLLRLGS
jgi:tRNA (cytidine32/uridine32-2'-O)-methyltransferase